MHYETQVTSCNQGTETHMRISSRFIRWGLVTCLLIVVALAAWRVTALLGGGGGRHARRQAALPVDGVRVTRRSVPLVISAPGVVQTHHSVAVYSQVSGILQQVFFEEGDEVKAGQPLFQIDPQPYQVAVEEARGQVEQDKAKLAADRANAQRTANLAKKGYVSTQANQNASALVAQDEGTLTADTAKLKQAHLELGYTRIAAPISGRTGALAYKSGNLIQANGSTPLVTINEIAPILVQFSIPQSQLTALMRHRNDPALGVSVRDPSGRVVATDGHLVFIDNAINQTTGTLTLKAEFPNTHRVLWPGELVSVGLRLAIQKNAVAVPSVAIQPGQRGSYVYTVTHGTVGVRNVHVVREYGGYAVVDRGLDPGDVVIVHIPRQLHEGLAVRVNLLSNAAVANDAEDSDADGAPGAST